MKMVTCLQVLPLKKRQLLKIEFQELQYKIVLINNKKSDIENLLYTGSFILYLCDLDIRMYMRLEQQFAFQGSYKIFKLFFLNINKYSMKVPI